MLSTVSPNPKLSQEGPRPLPRRSRRLCTAVVTLPIMSLATAGFFRTASRPPASPAPAVPQVVVRPLPPGPPAPQTPASAQPVNATSAPATPAYPVQQASATAQPANYAAGHPAEKAKPEEAGYVVDRPGIWR